MTTRWNRATSVTRANLVAGEIQFYIGEPLGTDARLCGRWASIEYAFASYTVRLYDGADTVTKYATNNLAAARDTGKNWARVKGDGVPPLPCADCGTTLATAQAPDGEIVCRACLDYHREPREDEVCESCGSEWCPGCPA